LRTKEHFTLTQIVTDYSHPGCHVKDHDDDDIGEEICPPEAETKVVLFDGYPSSPLSFGINVCLEYDDSNCYTREGENFPYEICREHHYRYEGAWVEGTLFQYICVKSETRMYHHPLQYNVRYIVEGERGDDEFFAREVFRVTKSIPPCS